MDTPPLKKGTAATVELVPQFATDGAMVVVVIVKERFAVDRRDRVTREGGAEVRLTDVPWDPDAPASSSIRYPSDLCLRKPSTDVVVVGSAVAAYRRPATALDVLVRVGPVEKVLRVLGLRTWYHGLRGLAPCAPLPFEELPLRWEYAWGGSDYADPRDPLEDARNPVGRGVARDADALVHAPAPQIEDPRHPIVSQRDANVPAGVAAVGRSWAPRRGYVGTADEAWRRERMPLPPLDQDPRFEQVATPELIAPAYLRGGEVVRVHNMCEDGPLAFELPRLQFFVGSRTAEGLREHRAALDTVLLEPTARRFELTWRAVVPLPKRVGRVEHVQVHEKELR